MREALRLGPTIPWRQVKCNEDTVIGGGKYFIPKGRVIIVHLEKAQRDPLVYGEDVSVSWFSFDCPVLTMFCVHQADEFRPERMMNGQYEALPVSLYPLLPAEPLFDARFLVQRVAAMGLWLPILPRTSTSPYAYQPADFSSLLGPWVCVARRCTRAHHDLAKVRLRVGGPGLQARPKANAHNQAQQLLLPCDPPQEVAVVFPWALVELSCGRCGQCEPFRILSVSDDCACVSHSCLLPYSRL